MGDFYAADPENKALQGQALHAIEQGGNDTARLAAYVAARIVDCHLATMARLGIRYDLLAHESDILRLHFWDRAFELLKEKGAIRLVSEGKNAGCWVLPMGEADADAIDEDKIIVRSNGTVTYTGKDIAYQLWKLGKLDRDFRYRRHRSDPDGAVAVDDDQRRGRAGRTGLRPRRRGLQRDRRRAVLPAARRQGRRRGARARERPPRAPTTSRTRRSCSRPPRRARSATRSRRTTRPSRSPDARGSA